MRMNYFGKLAYFVALLLSILCSHSWRSAFLHKAIKSPYSAMFHKSSSLYGVAKNDYISNFPYSTTVAESIGSLQPRNFLPLLQSYSTMNTLTRYGVVESNFTVRILQFNVLADGLSGSRDDLGDFSRTPPHILDWERRKVKIKSEILQYQPDMVTLQEVDHYHDYFLPVMREAGYLGFFAPKPTSKCLECDGAADGCALFIKASRFRVLSAETKTLALSKAELTDSGELNEDERNILAQNQVALIVVCEMIDEKGNIIWRGNDKLSPPIIIATTHLKSEKSPVGERQRERGIGQILFSMEKIYNSYVVKGRAPAVILSGDFNAVATRSSYPPLTYEKVKKHPFLLRSVYNDDLVYSPTRLSANEFYTTWKARRRGENEAEVVVKRSIDYIFYSPFQASTIRKSNGLPNYYSSAWFNNSEPLSQLLVFSKDRLDSLSKTMSSSKQTEDSTTRNAYLQDNLAALSVAPLLLPKGSYLARTPSQVVVSFLLRFAVYFFGLLFPLTSFFSASIEDAERWAIIMTSFLGILIFESTNEGSIFKPRLAAKLDSEISEIPIVGKKKDKKSKDSSSGKTAVSAQSLFGKSKDTVDKIPDLVNRNFESAYGTLKTSEQKFFVDIASYTQQLRALPQYGRPGFRAIALLDIFAEEDIGPELIPSESYPSDHVAIAADLELLW